jgi:hypothetical protein
VPAGGASFAPAAEELMALPEFILGNRANIDKKSKFRLNKHHVTSKKKSI